MGWYPGVAVCKKCDGNVSTLFISVGDMSWQGTCENCGEITPDDIKDSAPLTSWGEEPQGQAAT
jgi:uncharacterized Zn finger protein